MIKDTLRSLVQLHPAGVLRIILLSGCLLVLIIGGVLIGVYSGGNFGSASRRAERESEFSRLLREYDFKCRQVLEEESYTVRRQEFERLENELNRLEKNTGGVETWLSVLKRRKQLAHYANELGGVDSHYIHSYRQSSRRAAKAFPYSEPIAAVAAAALIHDAAITREGEADLREILPLLASPRLSLMRLGLHVLLGDFRNPQRAAENLFEGASSPVDFLLPVYGQPEAEPIAVDLLILRILAGDIPGTAVDMQTALLAFPSPGLVRLAAEYFYDFGDLVRSAELFSLLPDEADLIRQADALWLAGYAESARAIWAMLTLLTEESYGGERYNQTLLSRAILQSKALYNLAITAHSLEERAALLERLIGARLEQGIGGQELLLFVNDPSRLYGLIRFSRLLEAPQAVAVLEAERGAASPVDPLVDLEILKRRTEIGEMARIVAETWLLLDQYPHVEYIYHWGLWYFNLQRIYGENAVLLKNAARRHLSGWWIDIYDALRLIREGEPDEAEKIFASIPADVHWSAAANLGRILEAHHAPARALESYERAMAVVAVIGLEEFFAHDRRFHAWQNTASRIQVRIAHCLRTMGRFEESRRALEYALDLNEDNLNARMELSRLP